MTKVDYYLIIGMVIAAPHFSYGYAVFASTLAFGAAIYYAWKGVKQ